MVGRPATPWWSAKSHDAVGTQAKLRGRRTIDTRDAHDDVPLEVVAQAKAAFGRRPQLQVAVLVRDWLVDDGASWHHRIRFKHPRTWIEVGVSVESGWANLEGIIHPASPRRVELQSTDEVIAADVTRGAFRIERFARGLVRLALAGPDGAPTIYTDWFHV